MSKVKVAPVAEGSVPPPATADPSTAAAGFSNGVLVAPETGAPRPRRGVTREEA